MYNYLVLIHINTTDIAISLPKKNLYNLIA